jgi:hypothetical protein
MAIRQRSPTAQIGVALMMGWTVLFGRLRHWWVAAWGALVVGTVLLLGWWLRGWKRRFLPRWIVYAFYPVHLTVIGVILATSSPLRDVHPPHPDPPRSFRSIRGPETCTRVHEVFGRPPSAGSEVVLHAEYHRFGVPPSGGSDNPNSIRSYASRRTVRSPAFGTVANGRRPGPGRPGSNPEVHGTVAELEAQRDGCRRTVNPGILVA